MKKYIDLFKNAHFFFWGSIPIVFLLGWIQTVELSDSGLDINIHDTYFVIAQFDLSVMIAVCLFILGLVYFTFKKLRIELKKWLNLVHTVITLLGTFYIAYPFDIFVASQPEGFPKYPADLNMEITIAIIVVVSIQLVLLINIGMSLLKKRAS